jgi:drug/metabolite transporter (DMT)-like permease
MDSSREFRRRGLAWAFAGAVGGALFVIPWKLANEAGESAHSVLLLLGVSALTNTIFAIWQRRSSGARGLRIARADLGVAALLAGFTLAGNLASARAIQDLSPALLNVLFRAEVILVALFAWLLLGERVERRYWLGAAIAAVGLVVLQGPVAVGSSPGGPTLGGLLDFFGTGTGMALGAAACFSMLVVVTRHFIHRIDPVAVNAIRLWLAVALWFAFNAVPEIDTLPREQVLFASLSAISGPFFSRLCLMISARYVEARVSTLASLSAPALTLFFAFVLLSDWPRDHELLGGAIMIAGISIPLLRPRRGATPPGPGRSRPASPPG